MYRKTMARYGLCWVNYFWRRVGLSRVIYFWRQARSCRVTVICSDVRAGSVVSGMWPGRAGLPPTASPINWPKPGQALSFRASGILLGSLL